MVVGALLLVITAGIAVAQSVMRCDDAGRCEGTDESDVIVASDESQRVIAKAGDDDIELDETIVGGSDDIAFGGRGRDCIDGGAGNDVMIGGRGDDDRPCEFTAFVNPQAGMTAGPGDDRVEGGPGDDSMDGIADDDTLIGNTGRDRINDPAPDDKDRLFGGQDSDILDSTDGDGDDVVDGGRGRDRCSGDAGDEFRNCEGDITETPITTP